MPSRALFTRLVFGSRIYHMSEFHSMSRPRTFRYIVCLLLASACSAQQIRPGTVLPVMMSIGIDSARVKVGDRVNGTLKQNVLLASGETLRAGAKLEGRVVQVAAGPDARVAIRFERLTAGKREFAIQVRLRAVASMEEVFEAQLPVGTFDEYGTSISDWTTVQIGGAAVYLGDGTVRSAMEIIGRAPAYGVVLASLVPAPKRGCPADSMTDAREQSLWLFSPWACGTYGLEGLSIGQSSGDTPDGAIALLSPTSVQIRAGSGWLLEVVAPTDPSQAPSSK